MNRGRSRPPSGHQPVFAVTAVCALLLSSVIAAQAQRNPSRNTSAAPASASTATAPPRAARMDEGYTAKIREHTTEPFFMTELVDHLPASDRVPTPEKVLGYIAGAPNRLTYTKDINRYFRELERTSPRVRVLVAPERSEDGKEQLLVIVSDEANLRRLDRLKDVTARLADPRRITEAEARALVSEGRPFYWASGSIHSTETGSPEMLMELAYRLAVEETPFIEEIRRNSIVLITPVLEVDGRDRMVDLYNYRKANPDKGAPPLLYWGKYVAHDNNRDGLGLALALSRNQMRTFLEYHPQVLHDLHESVPFLYTSTGTGPYNAWLDPIVIDEWHQLAYHEVGEMTKRGVPGVWTHGFYDGWAPNYMFYVANGHNSIGRFYETFGNGGADTLERTVGQQSQRDWFRPNPPFPRVRWSLRNNVNLQQSALLLAMNYVAQNRERFLQNFYLKSRRAVAKATNEGPAAYVIPSGQPRPVEVAETVNLLRLMGVEVHTAMRDIELGRDQKYAAGSYVVRMDQPYSRMADMMLDTQYYNTSDPRPYDDTGWTLGAMRNIRTVRVADRNILNAPLNLLTTDARVEGRLTGETDAAVPPASAVAYIINHNTENTLATLRFRLRDVRISAAEEPFKLGDAQYNAGSFIIRREGNPADVRERLEGAVRELGLTARAVERVPEVKTHELAVPRIAILHTWTNTQNEGWYRIEFDRLQIPYTYISEHTVRDTANLRERFDVIIFPPVGGTAQAIVNGTPKDGEAVPWRGSELTPNMALSPDQTDNVRGGMGLGGVSNLQRFVEEGGLFVAITNVASVPVTYGLTNGVAIQDAQQLQARGSIYNARFADRRSPISYGYDETLPIYFNQSPLFQVSTQTGGGGGGGGGAGGAGGGGQQRPSGRGTTTDADIVQGMPLPSPTPSPSPRAGGEEQLTEEQRRALGLFYTPPARRPRVVLRFSEDERRLLVSGMLAGAAELANRPAVIDVPVGRGHVVLFATNPMWRHQTQGAFFLLFNAALNFDNLGVGAGRPTAAPPARPAPSSEEMDGRQHQ